MGRRYHGLTFLEAGVSLPNALIANKFVPVVESNRRAVTLSLSQELNSYNLKIIAVFEIPTASVASVSDYDFSHCYPSNLSIVLS